MADRGHVTTRLSVVTSVLNGEPFIADMLASVPPHDAVEHIAIDAGSTDGTVERLRRTPSVRLLERPGASLYQAWNEAIDLASGDSLLFLNADDRLQPAGIDAVLDALAADPQADIVQAGAEAFAADPNEAGNERLVMRYPEPQAGFDLIDLSFGAPTINAKVFRRRVFERYGRFDDRYRLAADRAFLLRMALSASPPRCAAIATVLYNYRIHPGSMTLDFSWRRRASMAREHRQIADALIARDMVAPDIAATLSAWRAREAIAEVASELAQAHVTAVFEPLGALARSFPAALVALGRARRLRRCWLNRVEQLA